MLYIGSDHAGFEMKEEVKKFLNVLGYQVEDRHRRRIEKLGCIEKFVSS